MTLYREHFTDENELPRGREGWIFAGTDDEFGVRDRWMVPVEDERLTRAEWEATIDYEAAGWAYWNEERIYSTEPDKPPFDNFERFKGVWYERARRVLIAAVKGET